jgi:hypothetical protein
MRTWQLEALQLATHTHVHTPPKRNATHLRPPNAHAPHARDELLSLFVLWVQKQIAEQRARAPAKNVRHPSGPNPRGQLEPQRPRATESAGTRSSFRPERRNAGARSSANSEMERERERL